MTDRTDFVTIVSGLPRSGTSMMMRMLAAGGLPVMSDEARTADESNPGGYFEHERVKALATDKAWLAEARGRALKVIYKLAYELPPDLRYRMLFMQRDIDEVLRSQEAMMRRDGLDPDAIGRDKLAELFQTEVLRFRRWAEAQGNIELLPVDYAAVIAAPEGAAREIDSFLGGGLDVAAMAAAVDPALYRNRG